MVEWGGGVGVSTVRRGGAGSLHSVRGRRRCGGQLGNDHAESPNTSHFDRNAGGAPRGRSWEHSPSRAHSPRLFVWVRFEARR